MITEKEKAIVKLLQGDIPLEREPFGFLAGELHCSQEEVIEVVRELEDRGIMRRFGAILGHRYAGFSHNAMVMWVVPREQEDEAGRFMANFNEISHCYSRETPTGWPYNMYSMIHARTDARINEVVTTIAGELRIEQYKIVRSIREFKKISMAYF